MLGWAGLWCAKNIRVMAAVRKGFLHTNIQHYKMSPVHLAAQINRFADSFLGPELTMGWWELPELLGILDFHFSRNGMLCVLVILKSLSTAKVQVPKNELHPYSSATEAEGGTQFQLAAGWNLAQSQPLLPNFFQFLTELEEQHLHPWDKCSTLWVQGGASSCPNSKLILANTASTPVNYQPAISAEK